MDTQTDHYGFYWHARNNKERIEKCSGGIQHGMKSKEGQSHVLSRAHNDHMGQICGENLGHEV